jgi:hypothetical protein
LLAPSITYTFSTSLSISESSFDGGVVLSGNAPSDFPSSNFYLHLATSTFSRSSISYNSTALFLYGPRSVTIDSCIFEYYGSAVYWPSEAYVQLSSSSNTSLGSLKAGVSIGGGQLTILQSIFRFNTLYGRYLSPFFLLFVLFRHRCLLVWLSGGTLFIMDPALLTIRSSQFYGNSATSGQSMFSSDSIRKSKKNNRFPFFCLSFRWCHLYSPVTRELSVGSFAANRFMLLLKQHADLDQWTRSLLYQ